MLETIVPIVTAMTTAISILSAMWIYRQTKRIDSVHMVFSVGVIIYTFYHFYACGVLGVIDPVHGTITGLFIASVAWVNAYCSTCNTTPDNINIGVCRRKETIVRKLNVDSDRRKIKSHTIFKNIVDHKG